MNITPSWYHWRRASSSHAQTSSKAIKSKAAVNGNNKRRRSGYVNCCSLIEQHWGLFCKRHPTCFTHQNEKSQGAKLCNWRQLHNVFCGYKEVLSESLKNNLSNVIVMSLKLFWLNFKIYTVHTIVWKIGQLWVSWPFLIWIHKRDDNKWVENFFK